MFEKIINLSSTIQKAKDGYFEDEREIKEAFNAYKLQVSKAKKEALESFRESNSCSHEEFTPPFYQLQRRVLGYVYVFQKECKCCGKKFSMSCGEDSPYNERNHPEGYQGATERYYNNNI